MIDLTLSTFFRVSGTRDDVTAQADRLMEALVDSVDDTVVDPVISFDAHESVAEVEVTSRGYSSLDAEARGLARIAAAMRDVGIPVRELTERRVVELVDA